MNVLLVKSGAWRRASAKLRFGCLAVGGRYQDLTLICHGMGAEFNARAHLRKYRPKTAKTEQRRFCAQVQIERSYVRRASDYRAGSVRAAPSERPAPERQARASSASCSMQNAARRSGAEVSTATCSPTA